MRHNQIRIRPSEKAGSDLQEKQDPDPTLENQLGFYLVILALNPFSKCLKIVQMFRTGGPRTEPGVPADRPAPAHTDQPRQVANQRRNLAL